MSELRISLLGGVHIAHTLHTLHTDPTTDFSESKTTHTVQALLANMLLQRHRSCSRDVLAGLWWGEHSQERARSCLSTTPWRLRAVLEPEGIPRGTYLVTSSTGEVSFNWASDYWLDVAVFEEQAARGLAQPDEASSAMTAIKVHELQAALQLYTGELLEEFYDDWALRERERLRALYLSSLQRLMEYYQQQGTYAESLSCGQLILQHDPLREDIHRALMRLHSEHGHRGQAMRQYEVCRDTLSAELGIAPLEETQTLYAQIVLPQVSGLRHGVAENENWDGEPTDFQQAMHGLQAAMHGLDQAREHLHRAAQRVQQFAKDR